MKLVEDPRAKQHEHHGHKKHHKHAHHHRKTKAEVEGDEIRDQLIRFLKCELEGDSHFAHSLFFMSVVRKLKNSELNARGKMGEALVYLEDAAAEFVGHHREEEMMADLQEGAIRIQDRDASGQNAASRFLQEQIIKKMDPQRVKAEKLAKLRTLEKERDKDKDKDKPKDNVTKDNVNPDDSPTTKRRPSRTRLSSVARKTSGSGVSRKTSGSPGMKYRSGHNGRKGSISRKLSNSSARGLESGSANGGTLSGQLKSLESPSGTGAGAGASSGAKQGPGAIGNSKVKRKTSLTHDLHVKGKKRQEQQKFVKPAPIGLFGEEMIVELTGVDVDAMHLHHHAGKSNTKANLQIMTQADEGFDADSKSVPGVELDPSASGAGPLALKLRENELHVIPSARAFISRKVADTTELQLRHQATLGGREAEEGDGYEDYAEGGFLAAISRGLMLPGLFGKAEFGSRGSGRRGSRNRGGGKNLKLVADAAASHANLTLVQRRALAEEQKRAIKSGYVDNSNYASQNKEGEEDLDPEAPEEPAYEYPEPEGNIQGGPGEGSYAPGITKNSFTEGQVPSSAIQMSMRDSADMSVQTMPRPRILASEAGGPGEPGVSSTLTKFGAGSDKSVKKQVKNRDQIREKYLKERRSRIGDFNAMSNQADGVGEDKVNATNSDSSEGSEWSDEKEDEATPAASATAQDLDIETLNAGEINWHSGAGGGSRRRKTRSMEDKAAQPELQDHRKTLEEKQDDGWL